MKNLRNLIREEVLKYLKESEDGSLPEFCELFYKVNDNVFWVRVLNNDFFDNKDCDGNFFGIGCQMTIAKGLCGGKSGAETYQLLSKTKKDDKICFKIIGAVTVNTSGKYFIEFRQRGNQPPGSNSVDNFSKDQMVDFFLELFTKKLYEFDKFSTSTELNIPTFENLGSNGMPTGGHGWSAKSIWYIMKNFPNKFAKYINQVPGVFLNHIGMIEKTLGEDFLLMDKSVEDIFKEDKYKFFQTIETIIKIKKDEVIDFLKKLNYEELLKDSKIIKSIEENLFLYIDFLTKENVDFLFSKIKLKNLLQSGIQNFKKLCQKLSEKGGAYKNILFNLIDENFEEIINELGGKGKGLGQLMLILNSPKYKKHFEAKMNFDSGDYELLLTDPQTGDKIKKTISDDNLIFNNSDRKKLLEKHKEKIKSFYDKPDQNPEIEYLRFLIPNLPEGKSKELLDKAKEEFIDYYDKKFDENKQTYPGKFLYNQLMNQLKFRLNEKPKKSSYDWSSIYENYLKEKFPFQNNSLYPTEINYNDRFDKKTLQDIVKYFYKLLKKEYGTYKVDPEKKSLSFQPSEGKTDEIKRIFSDYLYVLASLSGFDIKETENWLNTLKNNKFPIVSPNPRLINWIKNKKYFEDK